MYPLEIHKLLEGRRRRRRRRRRKNWGQTRGRAKDVTHTMNPSEEDWTGALGMTYFDAMGFQKERKLQGGGERSRREWRIFKRDGEGATCAKKKKILEG